MGYLGRRIGLSQGKGDSTPGGADGAVGGGILDLFASGYFQREGNIYNAPGITPRGISASGGSVTEYTQGSDVYRAHVFTSSGTFTVSAEASGLPNAVEYLVVAGGGGGGGGVYGGGGGAGGLRTNLSGHPLATGNPDIIVSSSPGSYTVTVGGGGGGGAGATNNGINGSDSVFSTITSKGGGHGKGRNQNGPGAPGGSGGGQSYGPGPRGFGYNPSTPDSITPNIPSPHPYGITQGNDGGAAPDSNWYGTGGGGAGQQGSGQNDGPHPTYGYPGGDGVQVHIAGPPTNTGVGQTEGWFAGGGGGGGPHSPVAPVGGVGGGGAGGSPVTDTGRAEDGQSGTGGGGGGAQPQTPAGLGSDTGGAGGSGVVVIRYKIAELTGTAKASGGVISFYNNKTIHAFYSSGTFVCPGPFSETCEYVVIGGGGSGGSGSQNTNAGGGGGGAGTYRTNSVAVTSGTYNITIGAGGGRNSATNNGSQGGTTTLAFPTSVASPGGGYGYPGPTPGYAGGSGGGTFNAPPSDRATGDPFPGTIGTTPTSGWGHDGFDMPNASVYNSGGGGGAGGAAPPQPNANLVPGGLGIQIPSTFRNPVSTVGAPGPTSPSVTGADTSGKFYVAGGGGGAAGHPQPEQPKGGDGGGPGGPYAGAGNGGGIDPNGNSYTGNGSDAIMNTGSGGGGGPTGDTTYAGGGGSGLVLIAYPT